MSSGRWLEVVRYPGSRLGGHKDMAIVGLRSQYVAGESLVDDHGRVV